MSATQSLPTLDFAAARDRMVDGQVRPNKVIDARVIRAMRTLPRERFLPAGLASLAYADEDVALPRGRALMEPMVLARLVQALRVREGESALVVGAGSGYGSAVLAMCGARVVALEEDAGLLELARAALPATAPGVVLVEGSLVDGWGSGGPFDLVLIEGGVREIPAGLAGHLTAGGRLATVVMGDGGVGSGVLAEAVMAGGVARLRSRAFFSCATPVLTPLLARVAFTF